MNLLRLDLLRFGAFRDASIDLAGAAGDGDGLHVVYGRNEAGKSTSLRALRQVLYGIPHNTTDNFLHPNADLRIGATLRRRDGRTLSIVRRKANKHPLRAADDETVLDPAVLDEWLGRRDDEAFRRRHGIDYDELVAGGAAVAEGKGDLATTLFAAGGGIVELVRIQKSLDDELEKLFAPRASKPKLNATLSAYKQRKDEAAAKRLRTSQWMQLQERLETVAGEHRRAAEELKRLREEQEIGARFAGGFELVARRRELRAALDELRDVPTLPPNASATSRQVVIELQVAEAAAQRAVDELAGLDAQLEQLPPAGPLIGLADAIGACHKQLGSYQKAARDGQSLAEQRRRLYDEALADLAAAAGSSPTDADVQAVVRFRPPRARVQKLARARVDLESRRAQLERQRADADVRRAALARRRAEAERPPDFAELERTLARVRREAAIEAEQRKRRAAAEESRRAAARELERLPRWSGSLEAFATKTWPDAESAARWRDDLDRAAGETERRRDEARRLDVDRELAAVELRRLEAGEAVPTEADLAAARRWRETGWEQIRGEWLDGRAAGADAARFAGAADGIESVERPTLAAAYEEAVRNADQLADRIRSEADRVARKAQLELRLAQLDVQRAAIAAQVEASRAEQARLAEQWRRSWADSGIEPGPPSEMLGWLERATRILQALATAETEERAAAEAEARAAELRREVLAAWRGCRPGAGDEDATLARTLDDAEAAVERWRAAARELENGLAQEAQLVEDDARREAERTAVLREQADLAEPWRQEMSKLSLGPDATPDEAEERLAHLEAIQRRLAEVASLDERIEGIRRDGEQLARVVSELLERTGRTGENWSLEEAPEELLAALQQEQTRTARRTKLEQERAARAEELRRRTAERDAAQFKLDELCRAARVASRDDLPRVEAEAERRRAHEQELQEIERSLRPLASPGTVDDYAAQVARQDPASLAARDAELKAEIERRDARREELARELAVLEDEQRRLDRGGGAVDAEFELQGSLARLQLEAREYSRIKLAATLLRRAVERYRERSQGPLLRRATDLFGRLTLGAFVDLRADWDDGGRPVLKGVRGRGEGAVSVDGMSTGTRDQLYLALRLASLDVEAESQEPAPLIVDDILIQFDDDRAAAALQVLAELGRKFQVVLFTHHRHVVDLCRRTLADDAYRVHELRRESEG